MRRLVLFAHFDPEARIRPYIEHHLKALQSIGNEIWFISNSPLPETEVLEKNLCKLRLRPIRRLIRSVGYDLNRIK